MKGESTRTDCIHDLANDADNATVGVMGVTPPTEASRTPIGMPPVEVASATGREVATPPRETSRTSIRMLPIEDISAGMGIAKTELTVARAAKIPKARMFGLVSVL